MIGKSIREILSADSGVTAIVGTRISPVKSSQAEAFPCLFYGTDNIAPIRCRSGAGQYDGTVEISLMGRTGTQIDDLTTAVRLSMDDRKYETTDYFLTIDPGVSGPDDEEAGIYYRRLDFTVYAQRR